MTDYRVLVTGARDWQAEQTVWDALAEVLRRLKPGEALTVVHGDCPNGADRFASRWCRLPDSPDEHATVVEERHPADWNRLGKKAGMVRNAEMVKLGADVCLAFLTPASVGGKACAEMAEKAGIPVQYYRTDDKE